MKINTCQFTDSYFPIMDGVGMTAHNYAYWLNKKYGTSTLVAPKVKDYRDQLDYKVYRFMSVILPSMNPYRIGLPVIDIRFKQKIKKVEFDLLHAHCPCISGQIAQRLARKLHIPLVTTFHTKYRDDFRKFINYDLFIDFMMKMTMDFYNSSELVWVPNQATANTIKEYGYTGYVEIMPNGSDMEIPDKNPYMKLRRKGLAAIEANTNEFVMLFVGQHRWEKNVRLILDALNILHSTKRKFRMVFVGEGYAAKEMKKLVKEYNLRNDVKFLGVISDRNELKNIYAASDLFIFPSIYDNSPLVMQEAAAFDVPSIVVKHSSSSEGIMDGVNGFLIENNKYSLVKKIDELMKDQQLIKKAGEGARKSIYHPWKSIVKDVYARYVEIIKDYRLQNPSPSKSKTARLSSKKAYTPSWVRDLR
jgi:1,2-diacylglycerol 3-alpha-glucosyltransferase